MTSPHPTHTEPNPDPWDPQPGESAVAYEAFTVYRDMTPGNRSTREVARRLGKSETLIGRWSSRHGWVRRVLAWDTDQDRQWRAEVAVQRRVAAQRQVRMAQVGQQKLAQFIVNLDPDTLTPSEAARWWELAVKVERQALGVADRVEVTGHLLHEDVDGMTPEEVLARLREVQGEIQEALGADAG